MNYTSAYGGPKKKSFNGNIEITVVLSQNYSPSFVMPWRISAQNVSGRRVRSLPSRGHNAQVCVTRFVIILSCGALKRSS